MLAWPVAFTPPSRGAMHPGGNRDLGEFHPRDDVFVREPSEQQARQPVSNFNEWISLAVLRSWLGRPSNRGRAIVFQTAS